MLEVLLLVFKYNYARWFDQEKRRRHLWMCGRERGRERSDYHIFEIQRKIER
ncbi:hypothetical protein KFK09_011593 [Dendrobium nobile]|uniref:Uncharacterized protein n=1 Tax=Dendrobium nobile TaxID=94219 RepID=A0A8T3BFG5_DENNO|nr:hypothetical protein KFK09_011593 [Dendrobium nobile]